MSARGKITTESLSVAVSKVSKARKIAAAGVVLSSGDGAERIIASAAAHGESSEPDHEVGDLREAVRVLWATLPALQREAFSLGFWDGRTDWAKEGA